MEKTEFFLANEARAEDPSGAKPREFERKIYLYISVKVSMLLPGKRSLNDVRQREGC